MGSRLRRRARSHIRATSRWLVKRTLPSLAKRRRKRRCPSAGTADQLNGDPAAVVQVLARALASARRRDRRGDDVLEAEAGAGPAVVARGPAAVLDGLRLRTGQRVLPVAPEEVAVQPRRDVIPGQRLVLVSGAMAQLVEAETLGGQGVGPQGEVEPFGPLLKGAAR